MKEPTEEQKKIWLMACLTAPIAHTASGMTWLEVLPAVLLSGGIRRITRNGRKPILWLRRLLYLFAAGEALILMESCWPGQKDMKWVMAILLCLAAGMVCKGTASAVSGGILIWWLEAFLFGSVLLSAIPLGEFSQLKPSLGEYAAHNILRLSGILLLPILMEREETEKPVPEVYLTLSPIVFSLCTQGLLGMTAQWQPAPFYELSRSIRLYGMLDRMESLAWLGLMMGTVLYLSFLLAESIQGRKETGTLKIAAAAAAAFAISYIVRHRYLGTAFLWIGAEVILEYFHGRIAEIKEEEKNRKTGN